MFFVNFIIGVIFFVLIMVLVVPLTCFLDIIIGSVSLILWFMGFMCGRKTKPEFFKGTRFIFSEILPSLLDAIVEPPED